MNPYSSQIILLFPPGGDKKCKKNIYIENINLSIFIDIYDSVVKIFDISSNSLYNDIYISIHM